MQEKESPLPTQVPPFTQGLGRQLLFLAAKESEKESRKRRKSSHLSQAGDPTPGLGPHGTGTPWRLTDSARAALPARGAGAAEGVPAVVARAAVAARVGVALELTCRHTATQRLPGAAGGTNVSAAGSQTALAPAGKMQPVYPEVKPNPLRNANLCSRIFFW